MRAYCQKGCHPTLAAAKAALRHVRESSAPGKKLPVAVIVLGVPLLASDVEGSDWSPSVVTANGPGNARGP